MRSAAWCLRGGGSGRARTCPHRPGWLWPWRPVFSRAAARLRPGLRVPRRGHHRVTTSPERRRQVAADLARPAFWHGRTGAAQAGSPLRPPWGTSGLRPGRQAKHGFSDIKTLHALISDPADPGFTGTEFILHGNALSDVGLHACKLLNARRKVIFLTPFELALAPDFVRRAAEDGAPDTPAERAAALPEGPVTIDLDTTDVEVYGKNLFRDGKPGAARRRRARAQRAGRRRRRDRYP